MMINSEQLKKMDWCFEHWSEVGVAMGKFCSRSRVLVVGGSCRVGYIQYFEFPPVEEKKEKEVCCKCCCHEND